MTTDEARRLTPVTRDMSSVLVKTVGRDRSLFQDDLDASEGAIRDVISGKRILVTGAAGSIGSSTVREIVRHAPALIASVDLSENNLAELVRDIRSQPGLDIGDRLKTFVLDFGSSLVDSFIKHAGPFDLVLHFAAMKHVRAERDIYSLSRLIQTNVLEVDHFLSVLKHHSPCHLFAISTDKACAPANLMGASKRLMEQVVFWHGQNNGSLIDGGSAPSLPRAACTRFANVAFSDGSLLASYLSRIRKRQPLAGPSDVRRYFMTEEEAGQICLLTAALAKSGQIFVPHLEPQSDLMTFDEIAEIVLEDCGYQPRWYDSEDEAKANMKKDLKTGAYPCCFTPSDTSGEKYFEALISPDETLASSPLVAIDVIGCTPSIDTRTLKEVMEELARATVNPDPEHGKQRIVELISRAVPALRHIERGRNLDQKM